jgi:hypothetical protein
MYCCFRGLGAFCCWQAAMCGWLVKLCSKCDKLNDISGTACRYHV